MKKLCLVVIGFISAFISLQTLAMEPVKNTPVKDPYQTMQQVVDQTFPRLKKLSQEGKLNNESARKIIIHQVMPYIDYRYAAYMVIGRNLPKTTKAQRERFVQAFYAYLVNTYSQALSKYDHQKIKIEPARNDQNKRVMVVRSQILRTDGPAINLQFKFRRLDDGKGWLAYDMIAEGVSLLTTNQSEVGGLINRKGIDEVSNMLENRQLKADAAKVIQQKAESHG